MRPVHRRANVFSRPKAGDHEGPPNPTSSTLAPTAFDDFSQVNAYWMAALIYLPTYSYPSVD
jgi:hypothetical protein